MQSPARAVIRAGLSMVGGIIGAGIFGIPAIMSELGIGFGSLIFWAVAGVALATHLLFVDLIARDRTKRRLPGYVGALLGPRARLLALLTHSFQLLGAGLAYCILGGQFLHLLAAPLNLSLSVFDFQLIFWALGCLVMIWGLSIVARVESLLAWMLVVFMMAFMVLLLPILHIPPASHAPLGSAVLGSIGVFLFASSGFSAIPEIHDMTGRSVRLTRLGVVCGSLAAALVTWLFGISVSLASSGEVGNAIDAMARLVPAAFGWLLPSAGLLAVMTCFITSAFDLHATYRLDFKKSVWFSWTIALGVPLLLLFVTKRNFLTTIGTVGALFTATNALLIVISSYLRMRREAGSGVVPPFWWRAAVPLVTGGMFLLVILRRLSFFL